MEYNACENCEGWCCAVYAGVTLKEGEPERLADHLEIPIEKFVVEYTTLNDHCLDIRSVPCPFWIDHKCDVHDVKPRVCAEFDPTYVPERYNLPDYECEGIMHSYYEHQMKQRKNSEKRKNGM
jgi:Fe-S-cluster containining protein